MHMLDMEGGEPCEGVRWRGEREEELYASEVERSESRGRRLHGGMLPTGKAVGTQYFNRGLSIDNDRKQQIVSPGHQFVLR